MCPINMTYASVPALRTQMDVARPWIEKLIGGRYAAPLRPLAEKAGVTIGMAMTEKQGSSAVRANADCAELIGGGRAFRLTGTNMFCVAPISYAFLTLAFPQKGLSCFLTPPPQPTG